MTTYRCRYLLTPAGLAEHIDVVTDDGGRIVSCRPKPSLPARPEPGPLMVLPGLVIPGLANTHSHAFHRALRGRTHSAGGTFWTWREAMYRIAGLLDPDSYLELATAVYGEMVLAGITSVGEFHYLHHGTDGTPYDDPNIMASVLHEAARIAGIRLTLLDTCYLAGGLDADGYRPLTGVQRRFGDADVASWESRFGKLSDDPAGGLRIGAAIHSVRAVPAEHIPTVVAAAARRPLHVHLSEQPAENSACVAYHSATPTALLHELGALGERTTAVHATHLTSADIGLLGSTGTGACFCPTTERDLGDGIGPASALLAAGSPLSLGSDQHGVIDLLEEARAVEMHERLSGGRRGVIAPGVLLQAASVTGQQALGWVDAGTLTPGSRADLVALRLDSVRTAGTDPAQILLAATAADVDTVVVDGHIVVMGGQHVRLDVRQALQHSILGLWRQP